MPEIRPKVYLESSIISYLTARPSRNLIVAAHQQITLEWWETVQQKVECYISPFVSEEIGRGDPEAAKKRLAVVKDLPLLQVNEEIKKLALIYFETFGIPQKAEIDSFHLATAVWYRVDYLLSWNCKHIANGRIIKLLKLVNRKHRLPTPVIGTPENLMEV